MSPSEFINPTFGENNTHAAHAQYCWAFANSFSVAANQLLEKPSGQEYVPILYLLGHSLELYLKAFLIYRGIQNNTLVNEFGHNLMTCLQKCNELGLCKYLVLSQAQIYQIDRVNCYYKKKHLEYFNATAKCFGSIEDFKYIVDHASTAILNLITQEVFRALPESDI